LNVDTNKLLLRRVSEMGNLPAMPTVLQGLGKELSVEGSEANIDRVVELISFDKSLTAQCLRIGNSPLFRGRREVDSVRSAVLSMGLTKVRDIVYSCSLPSLFTYGAEGISPVTLWRHALGTALVSQHLAQRLGIEDSEKLYLAGLLHDMGILVNCLLFPHEFGEILKAAHKTETPLCEVEQKALGFTHCESGRILADIWKLPPDISDVIELHHYPPTEGPSVEAICIVYLADLLCRLRGLGYGYYEAREFDLTAEPAWAVLQKSHAIAATLDLARFTLELDEYAIHVQAMVDSIFEASFAS
jgi:HD-like signal output (HDOD) protein